jgi:hypothetical protein
MSKGKDLDWTRLGTVEAMGEWLRSKADAICVVVVRPDDAVMLVDPRCAPGDAEMVVADRMPALLSEACSSAAAWACWVLLEGWEAPADSNPHQGEMEREMGRVVAAIAMLRDAGEVSPAQIQDWQEKFCEIWKKTRYHQSCTEGRER